MHFFFAKTLPFTEKEVHVSLKLFKVIVALSLYEVFFIILIPGLSILRSPVISTVLFVSCHIIFLATYLLLNYLYLVILKIPRIPIKYLHSSVTILYFLLALIYGYVVRFKVEYYLVTLISKPLVLSIFFFVVGFVTLLGLLIMDKDVYGSVFLIRRFIRIPLPSMLPIGFRSVLLSIVRTKLFVFSIVFIGFVSIYSVMVGHLSIMAYNLLDFWPLLGIVFIHYADSTQQQRRLYYHMNRSTSVELIQLICAIGLFQLPVLLLNLYINQTLVQFIHAYAISCISIFIGFLFPRSSGSTNETVATVLLCLAILLLYIATRFPVILVLVTLYLCCVITFMIKKETEIQF